MKIHIRKHKLPEGSKLFNLIVCNYIIANNVLEKVSGSNVGYNIDFYSVPKCQSYLLLATILRE